MKFDIVGIGVSVWDTILLIDRFPKPGAVVRAMRRLEGIGGGVTVAIAAASRLGSRTAMIDALGDDTTSARIIESLNQDHVDTHAIATISGKTASVASIWTETSSAERTIAYCPGSASEDLGWSDEVERVVSSAKVIHLNGRHPRVCHQAIELVKESGALLSFDGGAYRYREETVPMLRASDIAIVAREFAERHFETTLGVAAAEAGACSLRELTEFLFRDLQCEVAGVTDGARGSYLIGRSLFAGARGRDGVGGQAVDPERDLISSDTEHVRQIALDPGRAVDTTGCGDTYHGAFLHAYVSGMSLSEAARLAAEVASKNAQAMGGLAFTTP